MNALRKCWYHVEAAMARGLLNLLDATPLVVSLAFTRCVARLVFVCWRRRRRIAIENLLQSGVAKTPAEARRIAAAAFENFALIFTETLVARRRLTPENWQEFVELKLSPEAEQLLRDPNQGLIAASAHLGNWEVAARAVSLIKPMFVVYRPFKNPELDRVIHEGRAAKSLQLVSRLQSDPLRFLQALQRREIIALMIDQHVTSGRVQVDFFGRPAWTTKAPALLHFTTRAPLLLACAIRKGPLKYEIHAVGPVKAPRTGDRERDAREITQALTREIEHFARRYPEQYLWGHRRWKP